jgi:hypothetical protein
MFAAKNAGLKPSADRGSLCEAEYVVLVSTDRAQS